MRGTVVVEGFDVVVSDDEAAVVRYTCALSRGD